MDAGWQRPQDPERGQNADFDLLIRGGRVVDPMQDFDGIADVGIRYGRVTAIGVDLAPRRLARSRGGEPVVIDATDALVVPGLIDIHAHIYPGVTPFAVPADEVASRSGVTTLVSAGDAGANTIEGFQRLVVDRTRTRTLAFLNISTIGLSGHPVGEAVDLRLLDVDAAERAIREIGDTIVGLKVRLTEPGIVGGNGLEPLKRAVRVADRTDVPVMCHIGSPPSTLANILSNLRPGDLLTHCFTGQAPGLVEGGRIARSAWAARRRGVLFDVGHGAGSFSYAVAEVAAREGFWPDTISTDLHSQSINGPVFDLPTTMSKFLALGMPETAVIAAVTSAPASALGRGAFIGSLRVDRVADVCVLERQAGTFRFDDAEKASRISSIRFQARSTVRGGQSWGGPYPRRVREWPVRD